MAFELPDARRRGGRGRGQADFCSTDYRPCRGDKSGEYQATRGGSVLKGGRGQPRSEGFRVPTACSWH